MKRLTKKDGQGGYYSDCRGEKNTEIRKLGQLEDIEEEFNIDLITLLNALRNGIYDIEEERVVKDGLMICFHAELKEFVLFYEDNDFYKCKCYRFSEFGNTWALTKEELE